MGMDVDVWETDVRELFERFPDVAQYPSRWQPEWGLGLPAPGRFSYESLMRSPYEAVKSYRGRPNVVGLLRGAPCVESVERTADRMSVRLRSGATDAHAVLRLLVDGGCRVTRFAPEELSLESAFMTLTKGRLA